MTWNDPETKRLYDIKWIKKRRETFFKDKQCKRCESKDVLEFDHIIPKSISGRKKVTWTRSLEWLEEELKKHGQILCKECHDKKSLNEREKGEDRYCAKLTETDVKLIRLSKLPIRIIGKMYNVDYTNISKIRRRETWKHI